MYNLLQFLLDSTLNFKFLMDWTTWTMVSLGLQLKIILPVHPPFLFIRPSSYFWRRQWHPTPVLLPGKSHGQRSLMGYSPWGSRRVGHDWAISLSLFTYMHWRRTWQPTPVFLPEESQGRWSLVGCHLWGHTELGMTSWEIDGETVETVSDFIFGGLQNPWRWWLQPWN